MFSIRVTDDHETPTMSVGAVSIFSELHLPALG
jgi:hypothetical protein